MMPPLQRRHLFLPFLLLALVPGPARAFDPTPFPTRRPQEPKRPFPYTAEEVSYVSGGVKLAGTLTVPQGPGPFPAVLLITGSGPQDRDAASYGHQPFLVIADHLSRRGIAVLRVDDRGTGGSAGNVDEAIQRSQEALRRTFKVLRAEPDRAARTASLRPLGKDLLVTLSEDQIKTLGGLGAAGDAVIKGIDTPWSATSSTTTRGRPCAMSGCRCWRSTPRSTCTCRRTRTCRRSRRP